jgi:hypothetical protein
MVRPIATVTVRLVRGLVRHFRNPEVTLVGNSSLLLSRSCEIDVIGG